MSADTCAVARLIRKYRARDTVPAYYEVENALDKEVARLAIPAERERIKQLLVSSVPTINSYGADMMINATLVRQLDGGAPIAPAAPAAPEPADAGGWPEPTPLPGTLRPVLPFLPERLLPESIRAWVTDIAERQPCPIEFVAVSALSGLGSVIGRQIHIAPKQHDDWLVVPTFWACGVGEPGTGKTAALGEPLETIRAMEEEARREYAAALEAHLTKEAAAQAERKAVDREMEQAFGRRNFDRVHELRHSLEQMPRLAPPPERRFLTNDSTPEKLGEMLRDNPNGLLVFRDELVGLLAGFERKGREGERQFYLECWDGKGASTVDRMCRAVHVPHACLTVLGGIQPEPLRRYLRDVLKGGGDDGLLARLQGLVYPDPAPWRHVDRQPDRGAREKAIALFRRCAKLQPEEIGATERVGGVPVLRLEEQAREYYAEWNDTLQVRLRSGNDVPMVKSHLAKYRSMVPALAGILHIADVVSGLAPAGPVSFEAMRQAIDWSMLLESHALRVYGLALYGGTRAARALAQKLRARALPERFRASLVCHKDWAGLTDANEVKAGLELLADCGWLRAEVIKPVGPGRPTTDYVVSPRLASVQEVTA